MVRALAVGGGQTTDNVLITIAQKKDFFRKRGIEAELISLRDSLDFYGAHEQETIEITERFTGIRDHESSKSRL